MPQEFHGRIQKNVTTRGRPYGPFGEGAVAVPDRAGCCNAVDPEMIQLVAAGHRYCDLARAAILPFFRAGIDVADKATVAVAAAIAGGRAGRELAFDPVTEADEAAERAIREAIVADFPDHGVYGEELGSLRPEATTRWIIDPIDGTRAFITGSPLWGTLIGCTVEGRPVMGFMDQPFTGERFWSDGRSAYWTRGTPPDPVAGTPIRTRTGRQLADAILTSTHPDLFAAGAEKEAFARVSRMVRTTRYGGDCYGYALLALGGVDLVIEAGLKAYDIAPLIPIIEGAGGVVTDWQGEPATGGGNIIAAGDARLHQAALELLNGP